MPTGSRAPRASLGAARRLAPQDQPPPTASSTRPVPRQASQRRPSTSPSPPHSRQISSPAEGSSAGASSPGFMRSGSGVLMRTGYPGGAEGNLADHRSGPRPRVLLLLWRWKWLLLLRLRLYLLRLFYLLFSLLSIC